MKNVGTSSRANCTWLHPTFENNVYLDVASIVSQRRRSTATLTVCIATLKAHGQGHGQGQAQRKVPGSRPLGASPIGWPRSSRLARQG